jgi:hypothetical protein
MASWKIHPLKTGEHSKMNVKQNLANGIINIKNKPFM